MNDGQHFAHCFRKLCNRDFFFNQICWPVKLLQTFIHLHKSHTYRHILWLRHIWREWVIQQILFTSTRPNWCYNRIFTICSIPTGIVCRSKEKRRKIDGVKQLLLLSWTIFTVTIFVNLHSIKQRNVSLTHYIHYKIQMMFTLWNVRLCIQ